ncbi:MAG: type II toxin-antitoxin system VapC family toxin, partial [Methylocella sp.]
DTVIQQAERLLVSAVNVHEAGIVLRVRHGASAVDRMWRFLRDENDFEIVPFDEAQVRAAAFDRYGKGIHSKARFNLADCAAYALAKTMDLPLLFKGDDFTATDVRACL